MNPNTARVSESGSCISVHRLGVRLGFRFKLSGLNVFGFRV